MRFNQKKGFSLLEVITVTSIVGIVGGMSFVQLKKMKIRQLKDEAKIQLSHLHKNQALYKFKHGQYADGIEAVSFPQGTMRYNVGYTNPPTSTPPPTPPPFHQSSRHHSYADLCGASSDCDMLPTTAPSIENGSCGSGSSYSAFAVGDIHDDMGESGKKDKWSMDHNGNLNNCQDSTTNDTSTCPDP